MYEFVVMASILLIPGAYFLRLWIVRRGHFMQYGVVFLGLAVIFGLSPLFVMMRDGHRLTPEDIVRFALHAASIVAFIIAYELTSPVLQVRRVPGGAVAYDGMFGVVGWFLFFVGIGTLYLLVLRFGWGFFLLTKPEIYLHYEEVGVEKWQKTS